MTRTILLALAALAGALAVAVPRYACRWITGEGEVSDWRCRRATATVRFSSGA